MAGPIKPVKPRLYGAVPSKRATTMNDITGPGGTHSVPVDPYRTPVMRVKSRGTSLRAGQRKPAGWNTPTDWHP